MDGADSCWRNSTFAISNLCDELGISGVLTASLSAKANGWRWRNRKRQTHLSSAPTLIQETVRAAHGWAWSTNSIALGCWRLSLQGFSATRTACRISTAHAVMSATLILRSLAWYSTAILKSRLSMKSAGAKPSRPNLCDKGRACTAGLDQIRRSGLHLSAGGSFEQLQQSDATRMAELPRGVSRFQSRLGARPYARRRARRSCARFATAELQILVGPR